MAGFLTYIVTKFTNRHLLQVQMLHDITNKKQGIYTNFAFSRLSPDTQFAMLCQECRSGEQVAEIKVQAAGQRQPRFFEGD
ncbi:MULTISPECIES: hypothetical protein [Bradyrhizobium]|jgi:hypothetical protein|uniref:Uncharacterized protein n=1 Tax=Bradyrhizobium elkanii TaxID=29448 RepID=A0A8I1Y7G6_BRAEL|nr:MULTISPECIES: hypothetical protein [Bradyrhizobium]MBP1294766.1 hypothetical protein [Bradyrhizobium elkanii]MCP1924850.1 hypothetical protein [Bradyrhizobium elkanii]MCS3477660.1 hypothetical protein [Bradyrhizobium elkanii]MCS3584394.1 hypothetical protein [Bradyrhizobium elkanii]MCS3717974.1 hypothetical protein [Bradyrhizobium elkanii]